MGESLDPQMRQSPSGRHVGPPCGTNGFATRHRRATPGEDYPAPLLNAVTDVQTSPVIPGTSALLFMPLPTVLAPAGYKWSLQGQFDGNVLIVCPAEVAVRLDMQMQYQDENLVWQPLSPSGSGVWSRTITSPEGGDQINAEETVALLALRDLEAFDLGLGDTEVLVRVAWGLLVGSGGGDARFHCEATAIGSTVLEDERRGWDWSLSWVLRPTSDIS